MVRKARAATFGDVDKRMGQMAKVAERFAKETDWKPALEVQREVQSVPTCFPQYDLANGVAGHPISRVGVVHGPSNEGKSEFLIGLGKSFLSAGHFFAMVDAERTTPPRWLRLLMGSLVKHPGFLSLPVESFEHCIGETRRLFEGIADAREHRKLPDDATAIVGVDSLQKLMPKGMLKKLTEAAGEEEKDKAGKPKKSKSLSQRAGQWRAALTSAWMGELVPLLAETRCAVLLIAREYENSDAGQWDDDYVVGGGRAVNYDASIRIRTQRGWIAEGEGKARRTLGEAHRLEIRKTKVASKGSAKVPVGYYNTANGTVDGIPEGYDLARDLIELGTDAGLIDQKGSWYSWEGKRIGNGSLAAIAKLNADPTLLRGIEQDVRRFIIEQCREKAS